VRLPRCRDVDNIHIVALAQALESVLAPKVERRGFLPRLLNDLLRPHDPVFPRVAERCNLHVLDAKQIVQQKPGATADADYPDADDLPRFADDLPRFELDAHHRLDHLPDHTASPFNMRTAASTSISPAPHSRRE